jgi:serine/threonine-protein kinase
MNPDDEPASFALLQTYLDDLHHGRTPDRQALLAQQPDLASMLDCLDALERLAPADEQATIPYEPAAETAAVPEFRQRFGKYELEAELGRGGMGVVYRARQTDLDRPVALKMILAHFLSSPEHLRRFRDEARAAAGVNHPHIVAVYEAGDIEGQPYFAMQYVAGRSLAQALRQGPLEPLAAARLVRDIARGVSHLHEHGIVHRDLKPSNILLGADDHPYVTDFGLVKLLAGDSQRTSTGVIVGTASYMAPEQAAGRSVEVGPRSDVYSLGAILYETLTGQPPFREESPLDTLVLVLEGEPLPPRQRRPEVPAGLELICLRCLEKSPEERFGSAEELARTLDAFLHGDDIDVRPPDAATRLRRWVRREPALASRLAMLLICALVAQVSYQVRGLEGLPLHLQVMSLLAVWIAASYGCHRLLAVPRWAELARYLWAGLDVGLFSLIVHLADYLDTPVMIGYPLLVAGAGLWFRTALVWFTASLCVGGYVLLLAEWTIREGELTKINWHVIFLVGLVLQALVTAYQVQRVRALSRYYEHRPLP